MKAVRKNEFGFTLIELMIVVGIIGILVAIAAPNFSRYQSKARQSEAKIIMSAIFSGEKSFYSEYSAYIGSFDAIGFSPEGAKRFYTTGWTGANTATVLGFSGSSANVTWTRINYPASWTTCSPTLAAVLTGPDSQGFTSQASGQIRDATACDIWTIDDQKVLANTAINI